MRQTCCDWNVSKLYSNWNYIELELRMFWIIEFEKFWQLCIILETLHYYWVRQRRNNVVIFNIEVHNVVKRRNNVVKMTISKKNQKNISNRIHRIQSFNYSFITSFTLLPILRRNTSKSTCKAEKFLKSSWKILHFKNLN